MKDLIFGNFVLSEGVDAGEICIDLVGVGELSQHGYANKEEAIKLANAILEMASKE